MPYNVVLVSAIKQWEISHIIYIYIYIYIYPLSLELPSPLPPSPFRLLNKLGINLHDPATPLQGIYPEKSTVQRDIGTPMFTAALFIVARTWEQSKCPSTAEYIKMWYICAMEYY